MAEPTRRAKTVYLGEPLGRLLDSQLAEMEYILAYAKKEGKPPLDADERVFRFCEDPDATARLLAALREFVQHNTDEVLHARVVKALYE